MFEKLKLDSKSVKGILLVGVPIFFILLVFALIRILPSNIFSKNEEIKENKNNLSELHNDQLAISDEPIKKKVEDDFSGFASPDDNSKNLNVEEASSVTKTANKVTPTPTATPKSEPAKSTAQKNSNVTATPTPTANPTVTSTPTPTVTPTATPTPTSTPTATPTPTPTPVTSNISITAYYHPGSSDQVVYNAPVFAKNLSNGTTYSGFTNSSGKSPTWNFPKDTNVEVTLYKPRDWNTDYCGSKWVVNTGSYGNLQQQNMRLSLGASPCITE